MTADIHAENAELRAKVRELSDDLHAGKTLVRKMLAASHYAGLHVTYVNAMEWPAGKPLSSLLATWTGL